MSGEVAQNWGAGEQRLEGTRDEAGNETSEQPQAIRADAPTFCLHCGRRITYHPGRLDVLRWRDDHPESPATCFAARNLIHEPDGGNRG